MRIGLIACGALFAGSLIAGAAVAQTATPSAPAQKNEDRVICKAANTTGSRLGGKKICMPRSEWDAMTRRDRENNDQMLQRGQLQSERG